MLKKVETFLVIVLAICAVLLLLATGSRQPQRPAQPAAVQTPQTTVPTPREEQLSVTEPLPLATPPADPIPVSRARIQVEQLLQLAKLHETASTARSHMQKLGISVDAVGRAQDSNVYALSEVAEEQGMNPIAAFWVLEAGGLWARSTDGARALVSSGYELPEQTVKHYDYTLDGAQQLLSDLLKLAAQMEDGLELEQALLGEASAVDRSRVFYSEESQCRYAYFSCTSEWATYILCFYLRGEEQIDDVEFQLLSMCHADGDAEALRRLEAAGERQAVGLMTAAELLMTGKTRTGEEEIPAAYEIGGARATLERFAFTGDPDRGSLTNYRLSTT